MPILLTLKVRKLYMYIVVFVTPGFEAQSTQIRTSWYLWNCASTTFKIYVNTITYLVIFLNPCLNSIHNIQVSYVTSNTQFVTSVIPGFNTFMIPGVNSIYKLISYNKSLLFWLIYLTQFSYQIYSLVANCEANIYSEFITFW